MSQLQSLEAIEKRLWSAADLLRANSGLASNEYFMPVMGLIFLRHAYSRYLVVRPQIEAALAHTGVPMQRHDTLQATTTWCLAQAQPGDSVLLLLRWSLLS